MNNQHIHNFFILCLFASIEKVHAARLILVFITPQGYTKHYYLGQERIATVIGEGGWANAISAMNTREKDLVTSFWRSFGDPYPLGEAIDTYKNADEFIETVISHTKDNPFFQSLFYYDAGKDEFVLQDRTSWNLK